MASTSAFHVAYCYPSPQLSAVCNSLNFKISIETCHAVLSAFLRVVSGLCFFLKIHLMYAGFLLLFLILQAVFLWYCYTGGAVVKNKQTKQSYSTCSSCLNINNASILSGVETGFVVVFVFLFFLFVFSSGRTRQRCIKMFLIS